MIVDFVYTDFSKTFDKIDNSFFENCWITIHGSLQRWLDPYVRNKLQVTFGNFRSNSVFTTFGISQGYLFNLYINDISTYFNFANFLMYAKDLIIFHSISCPNERFFFQY